MIASLAPFVLATSGALFDSIWEGAILFGLVWLALRVFSKLGAATRYAIWFCTLLALVAVPMCTVLLAGHLALPSPQRDAATISSIDDRDATLHSSFNAPVDMPARRYDAGTAVIHGAHYDPRDPSHCGCARVGVYRSRAMLRSGSKLLRTDEGSTRCACVAVAVRVSGVGLDSNQRPACYRLPAAGRFLAQFRCGRPLPRSC